MAGLWMPRLGTLVLRQPVRAVDGDDGARRAISVLGAGPTAPGKTPPRS